MKAVQERAHKTKANIMQVAFDLFHQKGIKATSVDEILEKSGTGKSQFYYYFKNKDDLIHHVVQDFYGKLCNQELPIKYDINSWDDLQCWFNCFINFQKSTGCARGCPMATIGDELTDDQELIRQDIRIIFDYTLNSLSQFFLGLKAKDKLKEGVDPKSLAECCILTMQGGLIYSKINKDVGAFEHSVEHLMAYLKSLEK